MSRHLFDSFGIATELSRLLLRVAPAGYHTWEWEPIAPGRSAKWNPPVRVVLATGETIEYSAARVTGDAPFGALNGARSDSTIAVPLCRLLRMQRQEFSEDRTSAAVARGSLSVVLGAFPIALGNQRG